VLLTVGLSRNVPKSIFDSGRTLTVHLYYLTKEALHREDFARAFATAGVLLLMMAALNTIARVLAKRAKLKA
jgi:phosphate transport system permease protein